MRATGLATVLLSAALTACSHSGAGNQMVVDDAEGIESFFSDTLRCRNLTEVRAEVTYMISQFAHDDERAVRRDISVMLSAAAADTVAFGLLTDTMEQCLADPNSPLRDESYYIIYLEELLRLPTLPEAERLRPAHELTMARKNRPGTPATDFAYMDRTGLSHTLLSTAAERLLLLFYDPECDHCTEILRQVQASRVLADCMAQGRLTVLAVYTEGNRPLWDRTKDSMPREWTVAIDGDSIVDNELYDIPAMPVMYLLDNKKNIILKDAYLQDVERELSVLP